MKCEVWPGHSLFSIIDDLCLLSEINTVCSPLLRPSAAPSCATTTTDNVSGELRVGLCVNFTDSLFSVRAYF